jgi:hypothetical protein
MYSLSGNILFVDYAYNGFNGWDDSKSYLDIDNLRTIPVSGDLDGNEKTDIGLLHN